MAKRPKSYSHVQATEALEQLGKSGTSALDFIYELLRIFAGYGGGQVRRIKEGQGNAAKDDKTILIKNLIAYRGAESNPDRIVNVMIATHSVTIQRLVMLKRLFFCRKYIILPEYMIIKR